MTNKLLFKEWLGVAPEDKFGFQKPKNLDFTPFYNEEPLEPIKVSDILDELTSLGNIGNKKPSRLFENEVDYGNDINKLQVSVSPYGSLKIIIRKNIKALEGTNVSICHKIMPLINDYNHADPNDDSMEKKYANDIMDVLENLDKLPIMHGKTNYDGLRDLVLEMARNVRSIHPKVMRFEGVTQSGKNDYTISFSYNGMGVEAPGAKRIEQFDIHVSYEDKLGLIRCWGNEISSPTRQHLWYVQPSEWDEYFSPNQKNSQIIECIANALSTY